jgi:hypothetical protein
MTSYDPHDATDDSVKRLIRLTPDSERAERVRVRCRRQLERSRRRAARTAEIDGFTWRVLAPLVVGGFCALYVVALVATTLRFRDLLQ